MGKNHAKPIWQFTLTNHMLQFASIGASTLERRLGTSSFLFEEEIKMNTINQQS